MSPLGVIVTLAALVGGCSGGNESGDLSGGGLSIEAPPQPSLEERRARACAQISSGVVRCDEPSPDPVEQEEARLALVEQCRGAQMSAPLLAAYERCVRRPQTCEPLLGCFDEARKGEVVRRIRARQETACAAVSKLVTPCAESTMPAEEIARDGDVTDAQRKRHRYEYVRDCNQSEMSQRQVSVVEACVRASSCETFLQCMDQAEPRR